MSKPEERCAVKRITIEVPARMSRAQIERAIETAYVAKYGKPTGFLTKRRGFPLLKLRLPALVNTCW